MSLKKPVHVLCFAIVLGVTAYLASALWSAVFIVALPMDEDAITDAIEIETGEDQYGGVQTEWRPIEFKNSLEELKYYHNVRMRDRNRYWVYGSLIVGGLIGLFVFHTIPKWRSILEPQDDATGNAIGAVIVGVLAVLVVPFIISRVLPPPAKWFPQEIRNIAETRENEALKQLESRARKRDAERMYYDP